MCYGNFGQIGIPIEPETHKLYSLKLKFAWLFFDSWWKSARKKAGYRPIKRSSMPKPVRWAFELIKNTPIPDHDKSVTGSDSCYIMGVESFLTDS